MIQKAVPTHQGKLILDATVVEQAIRYPTDLSLLNEAREFSEKIIDHLHAHTPQDKKPRTYREKGRQAFLALVKQNVREDENCAEASDNSCNTCAVISATLNNS